MRLRRLIHGRKGSSMPLYVAAMVALMGFASISVDIGLVMSEKAKIINATDSAALAGAQELLLDRENAVDVANIYLEKNGVSPEDVEIQISDDGTSISVNTKKDVDYFFAKVLGLQRGEIHAAAEAKALPIAGVSTGVRPFAIEDQTLNFGQRYVLKEGGGDGSHGNYGALSLGGNGACNYKGNIINGYDGPLKVGDYVNTEPGNMSGPTKVGINTLISKCEHFPKCTFDSFKPDCPRVITVIIVDSLDVNGRKPVKIMGFASFFLEGVAGNGNKSEINGRFIKTVLNGEISEAQTDYGLRGIKLTR